ncbi:MAG TPA: hypothetical protein PKN93_15615 [Leptospiraceae bacterium]|nr:hypothetical protein [Leptospiraceae bacterium]
MALLRYFPALAIAAALLLFYNDRDPGYLAGALYIGLTWAFFDAASRVDNVSTNLLGFIGIPIFWPLMFGLIFTLIEGQWHPFHSKHTDFIPRLINFSLYCFVGVVGIAAHGLMVRGKYVTKGGSTDRRVSSDREDYYTLGHRGRALAIRALLTPVLIIGTLYFLNNRSKSSTNGVVTADSGLNIRSAPNQAAAILGLAPSGAGITVLNPNGPAENIGGIQGNWCEVDYAAIRGWAFCGFIRQ